MKKNIIIIGGGGFAIECYYMVKKLEEWNKVHFKGFTAAGEKNLSKYDLEKYYLGDYDKINFEKDDHFVIGIGTPSVRKKVFEEFKALGCHFYNLIADNSSMTEDGLGSSEGNIFCQFSGGAMYSIGNGNIINAHSGLAHDVEIGNFNVVSSFCDITGHAKIGDLNFFGSHSVMLPHAKIGNNNKIAAGSVIYKGCKDNCVLQGNPAFKIGNVEDLI